MTVTTAAMVDVAGRERRFAAARRHSRFVRRMRWLLPSLAAAGFLAFVAISTVSSWLQSAVGTLPTLEGGMLVMNKPRVTGHDANRRPYEINADRARQDVRSPRHVQLERIDGRIELGAGGFARVTADRGAFDGELERFRAESNVHVTSSLGYEVFLEHADMDMRADVLTSDRPVEVRNGANRIFGDRLRVTESGTVVVFDGNVRVVYHHEPAGE